MIYRLGEKQVEIRGTDYFVAHNATVIGSVILERIFNKVDFPAPFGPAKQILSLGLTVNERSL